MSLVVPLALGALGALVLFASQASTKPLAASPRFLFIDGRRVLVLAPRSLNLRKAFLYFHGNGAVVETLAPALAQAFDNQALVIVPQLRADGFPESLGEPGALQSLVNRTLAQTGFTSAQTAAITWSVIAHSGGFLGAIAALEKGNLRVANVGLLDALYGGEETFQRFAAQKNTRFANIYGNPTEARSLAFAAKLQSLTGNSFFDVSGALPLSSALTHRIATVRTTIPHGQIPAQVIPSLVRAFS